MSGTFRSPLSQFTGGNALMPQRPVAPQVPAVPQVPAQPQPPPRILQRLTAQHIQAMHGNDDQDTAIRKRDVAGRELSKLAEIANTPTNNRADIMAYIGKLSRTGDVTPDEAAQILQGLPEDQAGIRQWAREMYGNLLHVAVHAHAAYPGAVFPGNGGGSGEVPPEQEEQP